MKRSRSIQLPLVGNPVMWRELLLALRNRRTVIVLWLTLIGLATGLIYRWEGGEDAGASYLAERLFQVYATVLLLAVPFASVLLSAGAITSEREQKTLDMLSTTDMRPSSVLVGKLFAALGVLLYMLAIAAPLFAIVLLLGGISQGMMIRLGVLLLFLAISYGCVGLAFSSASRTTLGATLASLLFIGITAYLPVYYAVQDDNFNRNDWSEWLEALFSPSAPKRVAATGAARMGAQPGFMPAGMSQTPLTLWIALGVLAVQAHIGFLIAQSRYYLGPVARVRNRTEFIDDQAKLKERAKTWPYYLIDPSRRRPPIPDHANPFARKDSHTLITGNIVRIIRAGYVVIILTIFVGPFLSMVQEAWAYQNTLYAICAIVASAAAAMSFQAERGGGKLDLLRVAGVTAGPMLRGKLYVAIRFSVIMILLYCLISTPMEWLIQQRDFTRAAARSGFTFVYCVEGSIAGALFGAVCAILMRTPAASLLLSVGICLAWTIGAHFRINPIEFEYLGMYDHAGQPRTWYPPGFSVYKERLPAVSAILLSLYLLLHYRLAKMLSSQRK